MGRGAKIVASAHPDRDLHRKALRRGAELDRAVEVPLPAAPAQAVTYLDKKPQSWVTNCPHCDRIIGLTLEGNGK